MSKVVTCPVKRFEGTVTLRDPMDFVLISKWGECLGNISYANKAMRKKYGLPDKPDKDEVQPLEYINERTLMQQRALLPLMLEMVEAWELKNIAPPVTAENFPPATGGTSATSIHLLTAWLINECQRVYNGNEDDDPNA